MAGLIPEACDVTDPAQVQRVVAATRDRLGPVDRLVNAAGVAVGGRLEDLPLDRISRAMAVNYFGSVHWVRELVPEMRERGQGDLVLFASLAGWFATPRMGAYTASKFAVVALAETLRQELRGSGVRLRCVCPAGVATPMLERIVDDGIPRSSIERPRPVHPDVVLDAIDRSLARRRDELHVFPGRGTKTAWRLRRFAPRLVDAGARRLIPAVSAAGNVAP